MFDRRQLPFILAGIFLMTLQPLLVTLSQNYDGKVEYSPLSSTLLTEGTKLGISASMVLLQPSGERLIKPDFRKVCEYSIPAAIYFVNNNLVFAILSRVSATTFQLLSQLKTVFTGLLFRFFLARRLSVFQYLAIWQLACGTAMSQLPPCTPEKGDEQRAHDSSVGLCLSIVSCVLSAFGGIYSEKLLKGDSKDSIHWQNIQLYTWGIVFNLGGMAYNDSSQMLETGFFHGYNFWAYVVVLNNALNGLAISAILKYADNIARVYAHASAMLVTMVLSIFLFDQNPTPQLIIAIAVVGASAVQYNWKPDISDDKVHPSAPQDAKDLDKMHKDGDKASVQFGRAS